VNASKKWIIGISAAVLVGGGLYLYFRNRNKTKLTPHKKNLLSILEDEFSAWELGSVKEGDPRTMERIRRYWQDAGITSWSDSRMVSEPWSAAFISSVMKRAGAGDSFAYSPSHSVYIREAVKNRKQGIDSPFKAFRPEEVPVEVGDLVCYPRAGSQATYDTTSAYPSHCDLVANVQLGKAVTVGGNVSNSVSRTLVSLDKDNRIADPKYHAIIKNLL